MKNWDKLEADVDKILTKHFTKGRSGRKLQYIGIHYNAGNLTVEGCYSVWQSRAASAHYQVESNGRIGQLVWDSDTAWALGDWDANCKSISIEHANNSDGTITAECLDNGAHLVAALCKHHGLGRPQWLVNVFPHKYFNSTSCPGQIYGSQKDAYIQQAQMWYDQMVSGGESPSKPAEPAKPAEPSKPSGGGSGEHTGTGFGGVYECRVAALNVRTAPSTSSGTVAQYRKGQKVTLDDWYKVSGGWVWGRYTGGSGNKRYVAVGRPTGAVAADDYLVKVGQSAGGKSIDTLAREVINGKWGNNPQRAQKLRAAGYDPNAVQRRVNQLL